MIANEEDRTDPPIIITTDGVKCFPSKLGPMFVSYPGHFILAEHLPTEPRSVLPITFADIDTAHQTIHKGTFTTESMR